ncbi:GlxA family transcriptional regulator [Phaeobacter inhibens]|uniref:GlxA family transcriptional regulator n=1 Tax=Phaeobacter inhibens TaxID=221822 RepID=UPI000C9B6C53|nr:helix-turn-helix domain-containing protein [Phaeobacter inhibens]AUR09370.1 putative HTH-type transcriptional regulator, AraC family [Phaeobacter inhibens]AUR13249.1 putative HTH-type transcriptional regulator, AraC family [Phaeobacter inhibens]
MTGSAPETAMTSGGTPPGGRQWQVDIILTEGFVLTEFSAVVEPLRLANRVLAQPPFSWTMRSAGGGRVGSRAGAFVETEPFAAKADADCVFVLGNTDPDCPALSMGSLISTYRTRGAKVYLLAEAASRYIRDSGKEGPQHTTHWENANLMRERIGLFDTNFALASEDGQVVTCAGMGATVDIVLALIGQLTTAAAQVTVANILLHDKVRDFASLQPFSGVKPTITGDADLDQAIHVMQEHIEDPLPINEIVDHLGISTRSLERKFKTFLGTTPNGFYREMRLNKANNLLLNTTMSVREIGLACGFSNGFSTLYKAFFGITPFALRKSRRVSQSRQQRGKSVR